jgi:hypothetical protein
VLRPAAAATVPSRAHLHLGIGRAARSRVALFNSMEGLAVEMLERVYDIPPVNGGSAAAFFNRSHGGLRGGAVFLLERDGSLALRRVRPQAELAGL